jgi:hypothetical protein
MLPLDEFLQRWLNVVEELRHFGASRLPVRTTGDEIRRLRVPLLGEAGPRHFNQLCAARDGSVKPGQHAEKACPFGQASP